MESPLPKSGRLCLLAAGMIVAAGLAAYHNSFAGVFVYDDDDGIVQNLTIRRLWPLWQPLSPPTNGETVSGRPLVNLSLAVNFALGGLNVWGYHAVNLAIHITAALLLFGILRRTFLLPPIDERFGRVATGLALAGATLWMVHPLQSESVTYIIQRAESLMGLCYLLTLYCVIRGATAGTVPFFAAQVPTLPSSVVGEKGDCLPCDAGETPALHPSGTDSSAIGVPQAQEVSRRPLAADQRVASVPAAQIAELSGLPVSFLAAGPSSIIPRLWYAAAVLACLLGMASKEVMVTAPLVVLLYDRTFLAGSFAEALRRRWPLYLGLAATWGLLTYLVLSTGLIGRQPELGAPDTFSYARTQPGVILYYLRLCVWPKPLCLDSVWPVANGFWEIVPGAVVVALLGAATVWGLLRRRAWGFLGAWFLVILAPTSSILPLAEFAFEHRMYLSLAAVAVLAVTGGYLLWEWLLGRWAGDWSAGVSPASASAGETPALPAAPAAAKKGAVPFWLVHCGAPLVVLAVVLAALGCTTVTRNRDYRSSLVFWEDAVGKHPHSYFAHFALGKTLFELGRADEAMQEYQLSLRLRPDYPDTHNNVGLVLADRGQTDEAIQCYRKALRLQPGNAGIHNNLGLLLAGSGKIDEAIIYYRKALRLKPGYPDAHNDLANALAAQGKFDQAIAEYEEALRLQPDYAKAPYNLGNLLLGMGRIDEAVERYHEALRLKPDLAEAHNSLGTALVRLGKLQEAIEHYRRAVQLKPDNAIARHNLAKVLVATGRLDEGIEHYHRFLQLAPDSVAALSNLAWLLATREPAKAGDPARAIALAQRARELSEPPSVFILDALAAAYAAGGRFADAIATAEQALALAESAGQTALAQNIRGRLGLYRAGRPYREGFHAPEPSKP